MLPLPRPEEDLGPHQAYAYQWWLFMPGALIFVVLAMRRELADGREGEPEGSTRRAAGDEVDRAGGVVDADGAGRQRPVRAKRVRIWDEEDA